MLERMGLERLSAQYPSSLSGGEQQRVSLARALIAHPGLLLFDEPLSNLDTDLRERLRVEIATLTRETGATAIYITHDQTEAFALADRIGVLEKGRLVQFGTPEEIYRSPATPFVARFTGLSGELPCVVEGVDVGSGRARVTVNSSKLDARIGVPLNVGQDVQMLVRSTSTFLVREGDLAGTHKGVVGHLRGIVRDVAFRGRGYDHLVEVGNGKTLAGVFHADRHERGAEVYVGFDPDSCLVFPNEGSPETLDLDGRPSVNQDETDLVSSSAGAARFKA
jgi:ABC-type Fe3+/spermidine/putrescine transport system ATPase subunit